MKRNLLLIIVLFAILLPLNLCAQEGPKISGFVQGLYQMNFNDEFKLESNTLRMRRVRVSVDGKLTKNLSYKIQGDLLNSPMLIDAYVNYKPCNEFAIQIGQFKIPFTMEHPINPLNLEIFDYGESIQGLCGYNDVCGVGSLGRDLGIMATGDLFPVKGKSFAIVNYSIGVFNGNGPISLKKNEKGLDNNNHKDVIGRLNIHPMLKDLTISGSYYYGIYYKDEVDNGTRKRWSAGVQYNDGDLVVRAEYLNGLTGHQVEAYENDVPVLDGNGNPVLVESLQNSKGYYAVAGYNFRFGKDNGQKLMPVLRYEHFEPGNINGILKGKTDYYTVGIDYWPVKSLNFKLDYSFIQETLMAKTNSHRIVGILSYKF